MSIIRRCLLISILFSATLAAESFSLLEQSPQSLILEWNSPELQWQIVQVDDREFVKPVLGTLALQQVSGSPQLPIDSYSLPFGFTITSAVLLDSVYTESAVQTIIPAPAWDISEPDDDAQPMYEPEPSIYQSDLFAPNFVTIEGAVFRHQPRYVLQVHPLKYNARQNRVRHLRYAKVRVEMAPLSRQPRLASVSSSASVSTTERIKIQFVDTGVYRVTGQDLLSLGVSLSNIDPSQLQVFDGATEKPLQIRGGEDGSFDAEDELLFFAERLTGPNGEFYQSYTDTNCYWLVWNQNNGSRYAETSSPTNAAEKLTSTPQHLHFEKDLDYYHGDSNADLHNSFPTNGEGWVWQKYIDPGTSFRHQFDLPGLVAEDSVRFRVRVRGQTMSTHENDHHIRIDVNQQPYLEAFFQDREEKIFEFSVPASQLLEKGNKLEFLSLFQSPEKMSRIYLDWFTVDYMRKLFADDNWLDFSPAKAGLYELKLDGFTSSDVTIWDVYQNQLITPLRLGNDWTSTFKIISAGAQDGKFAHFFQDGKKIYNGTRGHNIVVLDPVDGDIVAMKTFDTWADSMQADSMALFVDSFPDSTLFLVAIRDEGTRHLTETAHQAMESLGSQYTRQLQFGDSWAMIGQKGAPIGSVPEVHVSSGEGVAELTQTLSFSSGSEFTRCLFAQDLEINSRFVAFHDSAINSPARMSLVSLGQLKLPGNQADYLVITHPAFVQEAERLAQYRSSSMQLSTMVVTTEQIYNEFNDGILDPQAIKDFLKYTYENWRPPAPRFVLLFGDASWDMKRNINGSIKDNFVPSMGNPVSDVLFVCLDGDDDVLPDMSIGRLPVQSVEQAKMIVDKVIEYDQLPSARWRKRFLFISGGFDDYEQRQFDQQSQELINSYVSTAPVYGEVEQVRRAAGGLKEGEGTQDIIDSFNKGLAWVNFIGHAGSRTWDLMFHSPDIDDLGNSDKYPFISSMTCHTGRFAEPYDDCFGEYFIMKRDRGAIGFWGTSGWGYSYEDFLMLKELFPTALQDSVRYLGDLITETKFRLWKSYGLTAHIRNMILQYNLLGDPASRLAIPTQPDLALTSSSIQIDPFTPTQADSFATLKIVAENWGLATRDSTAVHLSVVPRENPEQSSEYVLPLPPIGFSESISQKWPLQDVIGDVDVSATLDATAIVDELDETNNQATATFSVLSSTFQIISPPVQSVMPADSIVLRVANPRGIPFQDLILEFEIDTTHQFNSPLLQSSGRINAQLMQSTWRPPSLLKDQVYFWRVRAVEEGASWAVSSFRTLAKDEHGWGQMGPQQLSSNSLQGTQVRNDRIVLGERQVIITAEGAGNYFPNPFARLLVDEEPLILPKRGINIAAIDGNALTPLAAETFDMWADTTASDRLANFIDNYTQGTLFACAILDEGSNLLREPALTALESIGSAKCRNIGLRDSWALIGRKGAEPGTVPEMLLPSSEGRAVVHDTLSVLATDGYAMSPLIGPSRHWMIFRANGQESQSAGLTFDVLGFSSRQSAPDTLLQNLPLNTKIELNSISAKNYPYLKLRANFSSETVHETAELQEWSVLYDFVPDLATSPQIFTQSADSIMAGQSVTLYLDVYNIGLAPCDSFQVTLEQQGEASEREIYKTEHFGPVPAGRFIPIKQEWRAGLDSGLKKLYITVDPLDEITELNETNNSLTTTVYVHRDTLAPSIKLTFDERTIFDGDLVSPTPLIVARIFDNNPTPLSDTSSINIFLDGQRISFADAATLSLTSSDEKDVRGVILFRPHLEDGVHDLFMDYLDASYNTANSSVSFLVESSLIIKDALNFPNPFDEETEFRFSLSKAADIEIKIFTLAGRLVRYIDAGRLPLGYHVLPWDGRDANDDRLANGVYLYLIRARSADETAEALSKCIVMR